MKSLLARGCFRTCCKTMFGRWPKARWSLRIATLTRCGNVRHAALLSASVAGVPGKGNCSRMSLSLSSGVRAPPPSSPPPISGGSISTSGNSSSSASSGSVSSPGRHRRNIYAAESVYVESLGQGVIKVIGMPNVSAKHSNSKHISSVEVGSLATTRPGGRSCFSHADGLGECLCGGLSQPALISTPVRSKPCSWGSIWIHFPCPGGRGVIPPIQRPFLVGPLTPWKYSRASDLFLGLCGLSLYRKS